MTFVRITPLDRPVRPPINLNHDYTQAEKDAEARWIAERGALRAEFLKEWVPPSPPPADSEADEYFEAAAIENAAFECWQLRRSGRVAAATAPHWTNPVEDLWLTNFDNTGVLDREPTAASVTLPFLMEGGEFSITCESEKYQDDDGGIKTHIRSKKRLRIRSEHGIHFGELNGHASEMHVDIVILPSGTPQYVADRVVKAYSKIVGLDMPRDYPVVMPLRERCAFCSRPFTDQVSKIIGIGPVCASRLGVSHSAEHANRIITLRNKMMVQRAVAAE